MKCNNKRRKHSTNCRCFTDSFIVSAHHNLHCSITQCSNDANKFATRMRELGKYHARGIYKWDDGECSFHPAQVCLCGNCSDKEKLKCLGKPYESRNVITCPMHFVACEIKCDHRANDAAGIIDTDLGRGHTNLCESTISVLTKLSVRTDCTDFIIRPPPTLLLSICSPEEVQSITECWNSFIEWGYPYLME